MKYVRFFVAAVAAVLASPAFAGPACYTPAQMQAEQLLRLHSELMVITVTCRTGSRGEDLPAAYGDFTKKHIRVLHDAETAMTDYYKTHGHGNATDQLDRLRTRLANEFGQKAADMSGPAFCAAYRDRVLKFDEAIGADVENEVQRMVIAERSYAPSCPGGMGMAKK